MVVMVVGLVLVMLLLSWYVLFGLFFVLLFVVLVVVLLGWCWCCSCGVCIVLFGMLVVSIGFFVMMLVCGQLLFSFVLYMLLNLVVVIVVMLVFFLVQVGCVCWWKNCNSFVVWLVVLVLLIGGYVLGVLLVIDWVSDENVCVLVMIVFSVGMLFLYFIWVFILLFGEKVCSG